MARKKAEQDQPATRKRQDIGGAADAAIAWLDCLPEGDASQWAAAKVQEIEDIQAKIDGYNSMVEEAKAVYEQSVAQAKESRKLAISALRATLGALEKTAASRLGSDVVDQAKASSLVPDALPESE